MQFYKARDWNIKLESPPHKRFLAPDFGWYILQYALKINQQILLEAYEKWLKADIKF